MKPDPTKEPRRTASAATTQPAGGGSSLFPLPLIVIMATAFLVVLPWCFQGVPSGHDFEFHLNSWMEVAGQWKQGVFYPRWAAMANHGFGEPRFVFYPPASWTLGAVLGAILPWKTVPGVYVWIVLTLSGCSMFLLARNWLSRRNAVFAAALYAANPYHLVIVYWRSAFAELLGAVFLPLLLLWVLRAEDRGSRIVLPLGLIVAAVWLTNLPSAVMLNYSLALLLLVVAISNRSPRVLWYGAAAVLLGLALAAFYLVPAVYEQKWVDIANVLIPGVRPQDNFLFTTILNDPRHDRFNLLVSMVAFAQLIVLAGSALLSWGRRREAHQLWWLLIVWASAITLLMFPFTTAAWEHLPKMRFLQLPWRWLLCLNVSLALLLTMAWRRWVPRTLICVAMLLVVASVPLVQPPWWEKASDFPNTLADQKSGKGYEGTDEYLPIDADSYAVKLDAPLAKLEDDSKARIEIQKWTAEAKSFTVKASQPGNAVLRLFIYPAWRAEVNGQVVETDNQDYTGQMLVPVDTGENRVRVTLVRTRDQIVGDLISGTTAALLFGFLLWQRKRQSTSRPA
jgi:6-pyruvoyl-tetrahydropterin synthase related domain